MRIAVLVLGLLILGVSFLLYDSQRRLTCSNKANVILATMIALPGVPIDFSDDMDGNLRVRWDYDDAQVLYYPRWCKGLNKPD